MNQDGIDVVHAVTASMSLVLLKGQLSYLRTVGFHPAALCSPGSEVAAASAEESIPIVTTHMEREISLFRDLIALVRLWRLLRGLHPAICNAGTPKAGLLVGLAAWLNQVPCRVYTLRGLRLETATGLKRRILLVTERIACGCAHRVICVSPSLRQLAVRLGLVSGDKAVVLASGSSNGIDPSRFAPTPQKTEQASHIRQTLGIKPGQPVIGFAGRFTRDKGVPELLTAFQRVREKVPDVVLLLVGSYEPGDPVAPETRTAIESEPNVVTVEFTQNIDLYYLAMDIFVLPTHREGFPNTVLEAQAAERPVVTTCATGAIDSIEDGVTGLIVPVGDSVGLAEALKRLLADHSLAVQFGRAGRSRVLREFTQERVWSALADEYISLAKRARLSALAELGGPVSSGKTHCELEKHSRGDRCQRRMMK
jgi:glycosyltransferase involved in cell wall biosynthesis